MRLCLGSFSAILGARSKANPLSFVQKPNRSISSRARDWTLRTSLAAKLELKFYANPADFEPSQDLKSAGNKCSGWRERERERGKLKKAARRLQKLITPKHFILAGNGQIRLAEYIKGN